MPDLDMNAARIVATSGKRYPRSRVIVDDGQLYVFTQTRGARPELVVQLPVLELTRRSHKSALVRTEGEQWQVQKLCGCNTNPLPAFNYRELVAARAEVVELPPAPDPVQPAAGVPA